MNVLLSLLLLVAAAPAAQAQSPWQDRVDPATAALVQVQLDSAVADGLPTGPLVSKTLEGAAKRAPSAGIVGAVRTLRVQMGTARAALGSAASADEIEAGALALRAGLTGDRLARYRTARPEGSVAFALAVTVDLIARGVPAPDAAEAISRAAGTRRDTDLAILRDRVLYDIGRGTAPAASLQSRTSALLKAAS